MRKDDAVALVESIIMTYVELVGDIDPKAVEVLETAKSDFVGLINVIYGARDHGFDQHVADAVEITRDAR